MTWVLLEESGLYFESYQQGDATLENSVLQIINGEPPFDSTFGWVAFTNSSHQFNLNLGWSGRVRMTMQSFEAISPGAGLPFEASEMSQRASGDALVDGVVNDQAPYPDADWTADDIEAFTPAEFIGDVSLQFTYDPETEIWSGPSQVFSVRTATMATVSFAVLYEVEMDAVPPDGSFWTNLVNVRQEA
jgi:hypothetical protein